jgi:hypothetical protein
MGTLQTRLRGMDQEMNDVFTYRERTTTGWNDPEIAEAVTRNQSSSKN